MAQRSVVSSARLIALCTLASRVTGLVRDVLVGRAFGLGWVNDAFWYAFQFPNLFRRLFGEGGLTPVFIPAFTRTLEQEGRESAGQLLARTLALLVVVLVGLTLLIELVLLGIWAAGAGDPQQTEARRLLVGLTALMLPFMISICLLALFSAILNCLGSFVPAALAPILLNLSMIVALAWLAPRLYPGLAEAQVYVVALSVLLAGALQLLLVVAALRAAGMRIAWRYDPRHPGVRSMLGMLPPVAMGQGILALGAFLDSQLCILLTHKQGTPTETSLLGLSFTYPLREGALTALTLAQRLYQFPLGVLAISLATAALPAFTRLAVRADRAGWMREVAGSLRLAIFEGLLAGAMMVVVAEPIVRLLFEYGHFDAHDTRRTAAVLVWYGPGLWAFCAQHMVSRAFYSLGDARTPLRISAGILPLNVLLSLMLVWADWLSEPAAAFAISSSITASGAVVLGTLMLQRRAGASGLLAGLLSPVARMLVAGVLSAVAVWALRPAWVALLGNAVTETLYGRAADVGAALGLGTGVYLAAGWALRLPEPLALLRRSRRAPPPVETPCP